MLGGACRGAYLRSSLAAARQGYALAKHNYGSSVLSPTHVHISAGPPSLRSLFWPVSACRPLRCSIRPPASRLAFSGTPERGCPSAPLGAPLPPPHTLHTHTTYLQHTKQPRTNPNSARKGGVGGGAKRAQRVSV